MYEPLFYNFKMVWVTGFHVSCWLNLILKFSPALSKRQWMNFNIGSYTCRNFHFVLLPHFGFSKGSIVRNSIISCKKILFDFLCYCHTIELVSFANWQLNIIFRKLNTNIFFLIKFSTRFFKYIFKSKTTWFRRS